MLLNRKKFRIVMFFLVLTGMVSALVGAADLFYRRTGNIDVDTASFGPQGYAKLENGHFIVIHREPVSYPGPEDTEVEVLDSKGFPVFHRQPGLDIPDATLATVMDASLGKGLHLFVSIFVGNDASQYTSAIVEYDIRKGEVIRIVRTYPIQCESLHSDDSGVLWCAGFDSPRLHKGDLDYDLVYRFGENGELLSSTLSRAKFPATVEPIVGRGTAEFGFLPGPENTLLIPAIDRVFSFGNKGSLDKQQDLPPWPISARLRKDVMPTYVLSSDGALVAAVWTLGGSRSKPIPKQFLFRLSKDGKSWKSIENGLEEIPATVRLIGSDASGLIFFDRATQRLLSLPN